MITLYSWLDDFVETYKMPKIKAATLYTYDVNIRLHIRPAIADKPLADVNAFELQKLINGVSSSRTREAVYNVLHGAFTKAYALRLIGFNIMLAVDPPVHRRARGRSLSFAELANFFRIIKGHRLELFFRFCLYTGCRRGEALKVCSADVDLENRTLHIAGTKTELSDRTIPLSDDALEVVQALRTDGRLFDFRPDYPTHAFKKLCPAHKLHDLRHTFATLCLKAGIPLIVVRDWLGHSTIDTTADIYTHVLREIHVQEARKLNGINFGRSDVI